jgi:hypothetical protein
MISKGKTVDRFVELTDINEMGTIHIKASKAFDFPPR